MAIEEAEKVTALLPNTSWAGSRRASADAAGEPEHPVLPPGSADLARSCRRWCLAMRCLGWIFFFPKFA